MPRFNFNPLEAQGGITNLPKGTYTFEVKDVKTFDNTKEVNGATKESFGLRLALEVVSEGLQKGKKIYPSLWMHSDGARNAAKQFQLAVLGATPKQEAEWNEDNGGKDWSFDTTEKVVGSAWVELKGQLVVADLDITMAGDAEFQNYKWRPYSPV